jgi:hypothetical protein
MAFSDDSIAESGTDNPSEPYSRPSLVAVSPESPALPPPAEIGQIPKAGKVRVAYTVSAQGEAFLPAFIHNRHRS